MTTIKMEQSKIRGDYAVKVSVDCPEEDYYDDFLYVMAILTNDVKCKIVAVDFSMWYFVIDSYNEDIDSALAKHHFTLNDELNYNTTVWTYTRNK